MKNNLNGNSLQREIGFFSATILVVANMIGTGIFTTSGFIIKELVNPYSMVFCWFVGGIFALCGALCYGELGARFPHAGGEYVYLRECFGKWMGFLSGWISLIVGFSAPIAAASIAFATYFFEAFSFPHDPVFTVPVLGVNLFTFSPLSAVAIGTIIILSVVHYHSLLFGTKFQNLLTIFKIGVISAFIIGAFSVGKGSFSHFSQPLNLKAVFQEEFAVSLIFVSFAYSGWNAAAYLGGEIKSPEKNIPLSLVVGTFVVMGLYMLLNIVYVYALSPTEMSGVLDVGAKSAVSLFGSRMSMYVDSAISIGLLSVLSAMIMAGPRVYYAMAKDGTFFELFSKVNKIHRTPAYSIFLQAGIAIVMVVTASFEKLLIYIGFTLSLFAMLTIAGMVRIRIKEPHQDIRYRTFGYPITPILFILGNLWIIFFSIKSRPVTSLLGFLTIFLGLCLYFYFFSKLDKGGYKNDN